MAKSRRAASGDPAETGVRTGFGLRRGSARGRLRKRRASSAASRKSMKPQLSRITSRRSPYSAEAASVQCPAALDPPGMQQLVELAQRGLGVGTFEIVVGAEQAL